MSKIIIKAILLELLVNAISIIGIFYLWNALMPEIIMAKEISLIQAWGIRTLVQFCMWSKIHDKK